MRTRSFIGFIAAGLAFAVVVWANFHSLAIRREAAGSLQHSIQVGRALEGVESTLIDAETGQRGFLVTNAPEYLEPYHSAAARLEAELSLAESLLVLPDQLARMQTLRRLAGVQMGELRKTIELAQGGRHDEAVAQVKAGGGLRNMNALRATLAEMEAAERRRFSARELEYESAIGITSGALSASIVLLGLLLGFSAWMTRRDIASRQRLLERETFLRDAGLLLSSSLDYQQTLSALAKLAVPAIADWCAIDILVGNDRVERLAVAHVDPAKVELAHKLWAKLPPDPKQPTGFFHIVRTGQPEFYPAITDQMLVAAVPDAEVLAMFRQLGLRSSMAVPLRVRNRALGVLSLVTAESGRRYTEEDLASAQKLAQLAALAVDNAHFFREAQAANRLKDEFLSTISHELRTPLTAMLGWAHILNRETPAGTKQHQAAEIIERNARAQATLITDLLDVSRIISGKVRLEVRPVSLVEVLDAALHSAQPAADARQVRLQRIVDPSVGLIQGDPDRLQQVIWNLLSNAFKFTPKGGRVTVRLAPVNSHVELEVADTGQGISAEFLPHVFERFRQEDSSSQRSHQGLGLGLAIARHLVELHGGTIAASSPGPGKGASFVVSLPRFAGLERANPVQEDPTAPVPVAWSEPPDLAGARILVVDDQDDTRALLAELLETCHASVAGAPTAAAAEELLGKEKFDLLISDLGMPGRDGYELIRAVRAGPQPGARIPAVAVTAYARAEDRSRVLRAGFDAHLAKPIEPAELLEVVAAVLRRSQR